MERNNNDYERYQLEWMIENGYSLEDLMDCLTQQEGYLNIGRVFDDWQRYSGFDGGNDLWKSRDEFYEDLDDAASIDPD